MKPTNRLTNPTGPQNINHYFEVGFDDQAVFDEAGNSRKAKQAKLQTFGDYPPWN